MRKNTVREGTYGHTIGSTKPSRFSHKVRKNRKIRAQMAKASRKANR